MRSISAPGKVVVSGEYAVLDGCVAIVLAVDVRAVVRWQRASPAAGDRPSPRVDDSPGTWASPPELVLTRRVAEERLGALEDMTLELDTTALRQGDKKYGLGSSAAAAAATALAVLDAHGRANEPGARRLALELAYEGHRSVAPRGSGVDVAAACLGGCVRFRREGTAIVESSSITLPATLVPVLLWTGTPARTSELVAKTDALRERDPAAHRAAIARIVEAAERFASVLGSDPKSAMEAIDAHGEAMAALGRAADAPIVTDALAEAARLARAVGGAAKPSGAGGGDIAIALVPSEEAAMELRRSAEERGLTPLRVGLGAQGVRIDPRANVEVS